MSANTSITLAHQTNEYDSNEEKRITNTQTHTPITNVLLCLLISLQTTFHFSWVLERPIVFNHYVLNAINDDGENKKTQKRFLALLNIMSYMGISLHNARVQPERRSHRRQPRILILFLSWVSTLLSLPLLFCLVADSMALFQSMY